MHEYNKLISSTVTNFNGEECSFIKLSKYMQNEDRNVRKKAFYAWSDMYKSISEKLDGIYDELIITRNNIAKTLEFDSYIDYVYTSKCRYNYSPEDVVKFRENVLKHIVPVCEKILDNQRKRLGVDKLERYDELLTDVDGNATPIGDKDYILDVARKMFGELSLETKEFFEFMTEHELYDLDARFGKQSGGYCATLTSEKSPFIFANFNGTNHDITVLTHESGHAFESYTASRLYPLTSLIHSSSEVAEIHSMSMELLAYPWMEGFFGDKADRYRTRHLEKALIAVPFIICVDEFQHMVFENNLSAEGRRKAWRDLERKYMPWRSYDRNEFLESGGFWMQQSHMFTVPFYYIEYGLAQLSAFDIYRNVDRDYKIGWEQYLKLCKSAGTRGYFDTLDYAQVANPFKEETIRNITKFLEKKLL